MYKVILKKKKGARVNMGEKSGLWHKIIESFILQKTFRIQLQPNTTVFTMAPNATFTLFLSASRDGDLCPQYYLSWVTLVS